MAEFNERYPEIQIHLTVINLIVDVIGDGHNAGIRYGGTVPEDMIAQRLSPDIRRVVAGTPDYLKRFGVPEHPTHLLKHRCLRIRLGNGATYHWEFDKRDESLSISVPGIDHHRRNAGRPISGTMSFSFENNVALVTGAASWIGLATAKAFAQAGSSVALVDINGEATRVAAEASVGEGHRTIGIQCDVEDIDQVEAMVSETIATFGRLDGGFWLEGGPRRHVGQKRSLTLFSG